MDDLQILSGLKITGKKVRLDCGSGGDCNYLRYRNRERSENDDYYSFDGEIGHEDHKIQTDNYSDIIKSIALLQRALARLLDIEASEIEKMIACSGSAEEIIKLNGAVSKNISKALHVEQLIVSILDAFDDIVRM